MELYKKPKKVIIFAWEHEILRYLSLSTSFDSSLNLLVCCGWKGFLRVLFHSFI